MRKIAKGIWKHAPALIGVAVSGSLLFLALRDVRFRDIARAIAQARVVWLIPMCAIMVGELGIRALRWRLLLPHGRLPMRKATVWQLLRLEAIGLAINNVVFLRIGELVRAYLAARELEMPALTSIATIMIERVLDMIALTLLFAIAARGQESVIPRAVGETALLIAAGLTAALIALSFSARFLSSSAAGRLKRGSPRVHGLLEQGILGAQALRSWRISSEAALLSMSLWLVDAAVYWTGAQAMHLEPSLGYGRSILVLAAAAASSFLPAVPGSFGTFEQAIKTFLVHLNFDPTIALGYAGFVHVIGYALVTGLGILFLYQAGHTLASLKAIRKSS